MHRNHLQLRQILYKLGRTRIVIILTFLALLFALVCTIITEFFLLLFGMEVDIVRGLIVATCVCLMVAPVMCWYFVRQYFEILHLEEEMRDLATYDSLTGLMNRREFIERAEHLFQVANRERSSFSLIIVDMDKFKEINDRYGHVAGDKVLESFGDAVRNTFRDSDLSCRFGGDEFVFFLPNTSSKDAMMFIKRLRSIISEVVEVDRDRIDYTASIGVATYPEVASNHIDDVIRAADKALYHAKELGGNQTQIYRDQL